MEEMRQRFIIQPTRLVLWLINYSELRAKVENGQPGVMVDDNWATDE